MRMLTDKRLLLTWALVLALAATLRLWGLVFGPPEWHADEFYLIFTPLKFFSGDLNPGQDLTAFYPGLHYYVLAVFYGVFLLARSVASGASFLEVLAEHYFWDPDAILLIARLVSVGFALGTVWWAGRLAARVGGEQAGWCAGLLVAVGVIHVRQSPLAAVDVPMAFWYVGAVWAAVRLLKKESLRDYILAGALVGLAAAAKYPGALAGAAVAAAHWTAGRGLRDGRIWLAGLMALGAFVAASPYALLDYEVFARRFAGEFGHLQRGRGGLDEAGVFNTGWWYYLSFCLRHNLGWTGLALAAVGSVWVLRTRRREGWVVLAGFVGYWLFMGEGKLVFVRYGLPLMVLQAVLAGCALATLPWRRWRWALVLAACVGPGYGAVRVAQLQAATDTRAMARAWVEREVPAGARLGNFGGWAGDVQLGNFETLWLRLTHFERDYGRASVTDVLDNLQQRMGTQPHYWWLVHSGNRQLEGGQLALLRDRDAAYAILHRHPLSYSRVDSAFAKRLAAVGTRVARFAPRGLDAGAPQYDPIDAYYIPVAAFGALRQTGPEIEIWRLDRYGTVDRGAQTARQIFATGYAALANTLSDTDPAGFAAAVALALELDGENAAALELLARLYQREGRAAQAAATYGRLVARHPDAARFWRALGEVQYGAGAYAEAKTSFAAALQRQPAHPLTHNNLAVLHLDEGDEQQALAHWRRAAALDPYYAEPRRNIGLTHARAGRYAEGIEYLQQALALEPTRADLYFKIAQAYQSGLQQPARAAEYWEKGIGHAEDADAYLQLIQARGALGDKGAVRAWIDRFVARFPDHPRRAALEQLRAGL